MSMGFSLPCTRTLGALFVVMCRSLPPNSIIFFSSSLSVIPDIVAPFLEHSFPNHFLDRGHSQRDLDQAAAAQREHAVIHGLLLQFESGRADQNQFAQFVIDLHDLVKTDASLVSGLVARS